MTVKTWFVNKEFSQQERYAISTVDPIVVKETEKAVFLKWPTKFGVIKKWVPKSCLEETPVATPEMIKAFRKMEEERDKLNASIKKGVNVRRKGGRKVYTVLSDYASFGKVRVTDGIKQREIELLSLEIVE